MDPSPLDDADLALPFVRLLREGAYADATPVAMGTHAFGVFSSRNGYLAPVATLSREQVAHALERGWIARDGRSGRHQLTREGRRAVRRALALSPSRAMPRKRPEQGTRTRPAPSANARASGPESPLAWLRRRKNAQGQPLLPEPLFEAGMRLAADYAKAQMQARITASWSLTASCNRLGNRTCGHDVSEFAQAARDRLYRALGAVGPDMTSLVLDVCCHEIGLEAAEKARKWPARSGKVVLDLALTVLARHYGLLPSGQPTASSQHAPLRAWRDEDCAPTLDAWS